MCLLGLNSLLAALFVVVLPASFFLFLYMCLRGSFLLFLLFLVFLAFLAFLVLLLDNTFAAVFLDFEPYRVVHIRTRALFT